MLLLPESGRRICKKSIATEPEGSHQGLAPVEAAVSGLMGLIIALTLSGTALLRFCVLTLFPNCQRHVDWCCKNVIMYDAYGIKQLKEI